MCGHNAGMDVADDELARRLAHVYWLGGASGAGKSTIAARLAERHDLQLYSTDDVMPDHAGRSTAETSPQLAEFVAMSMDERWVDRSPEAMLDSFHWYRGEAFDLIVEDLLALSPAPVIAEGFRLLPSLVDPLAGRARAVWLLPTPQFRRAAFEERGSLWSIANRTSDAERALRNLLERDAMFTERLRADVAVSGRPAVEVDVGDAEDDILDRVSRRLGLGQRHADSGVWPNLGKTLDGLIQS
jgi:hypothetical protein